MRRLDVVAWYGGYWEPAPDPPKTYTQPPDGRHTREDAPRRSKDPAVLKRVGIVMGRFRPPHRGHGHLVEEAFAQCGLLYLISPRPNDGVGRFLHRTMLERSFESFAEINIVDAPANAADPVAWKDIVKDVAPHATHLFSSDTRAEELARKLAIEHVLVDPDRSVHHVCARDVRTDVYGMFRWILPSARPALALTIGIVGPECAGKTTLARELQSEFGAVVVEDRLRVAAERRGGMPTKEDFERAIIEAGAERRSAQEISESGVVVVDSTTTQTVAWARRLNIDGVPDHPETCDLWLLCHDDFGFVGPPERDKPEDRRQMIDALRSRLGDQRIVEIHGDGAARVDAAVEAIRALMYERANHLKNVLS